MIYAPVLIPTLNRYDHFVNLISSLQKNKLAEKTDLYIGLDYPPNEKYTEGYDMIKDYLSLGIQGFRSVNVIQHQRNVGATENIESLINEIRNKYDRFILSEDDNVFSPCYLEYMNLGLDLIKDDDDLMCVCGYSYPVKWIDRGLGVIKEQSFVSAWGFGTFLKKYDKIGNQLRNGYYNKKVFVKLKSLRKKSKKNYVYCVSQLYGNHGLIPNDIGLSCYQLLENKYCLMPTTSLVRNNGWDGSGVNCHNKNEDFYSKQVISSKIDFYLPENIQKASDIIHIQENEFTINAFYPSNKLDYFKCLIKELILKFRIVFKVMLYE